MSVSGKKQLNKIVVKEKSEEKILDGKVEDYDGTFALAKRLLKILGFRMMLTDTKIAEMFWNALFWFNFTNVCIAATLESINMFLMAAVGTFFDLFTMMPCVGYLVVALSKAYKMKRYQHVFENLIYEPRTMWPEGRISEEEHKITTVALARIKLFDKVYFLSNFVLACTFVVPPIITWVRKKAGHEVELLLPFSYWLPYDVNKNNRYEITFLIQSYQCFFAVGCMIIGDLLFCIFLNHITTQFHLLTLKINKLYYVPIDEQVIEDYPLGKCSKMLLLNDEEHHYTTGDREQALHNEFLAIIQRHHALIRLSGDVENLYTFTLLVNFMNSSVIICFCLFCCAFIEKWNEFMYKLFFATAVMQIWMLCWYGQRLLDTSTGVGEALYNCGWYLGKQGMKKSILIMIQRSQNPVHITTYGFSIISLENFSTIMKTSWSYFTLLINMYNT